MRDQTLLGLLLSAFVQLVLVGCASSKANRPAVSHFGVLQAQIDELDLLAMPVALNLDAAPGVDGFAIRVFALDRSRPKAQPLASGVMEILMYDGFLREVLQDAGQYRKTWSFSAEQLKAYAFASTIGTGYRFTLNWGVDKPHADRITVAVRYRSAQGKTVTSAPSSISVAAK